MSRLNKLILYVLILLVICPVFGQFRDDVSSRTLHTFKEAVEQYNAGNYSQADQMIEDLSRQEKERYKEEIGLLSMRVKYRLNEYEQSLELGKTFMVDHPHSDYKTDVLLTIGDVFLAQGMYDASFRMYLRSYRGKDDDKYQGKIMQRIFLPLQFGISPLIIEELLATEIDRELINVLLLAQVHTELQMSQDFKATNTLSKLDIEQLSETGYDYYLKLSDKLDNNTGNAIIGVVLPLSGKEANIGTEFINGLQYANDSNYFRDLELSFVVYDNAGDALKTLEIFQTLYKNPNIVAIIGPFSSYNALIAGSSADKEGRPIILPTVTMNGLTDISENIFLMNSDLRTRGELTGKFIAGNLQAKNIAVLAPADKFGKALVDAFTKELENFNTEPQIIEWYSGIPTNLDRQFRSIRARAWELSDTSSTLETLPAVIDSTLIEEILEEDEMTADDSLQVMLSAIDAIYMPIHEGHLEYVGAQYPAYNLDALVVGNDNWTDLELLRKENIGPHLTEMIVISNYNSFYMDRLNNSVNGKHNSYFYQALDCYDLLIHSIKEAHAQDIPLIQALENTVDHGGMFGTYSFTIDNHVNSKLNVVRFDGFGFDDYPDYTRPIQY